MSKTHQIPPPPVSVALPGQSIQQVPSNNPYALWQVPAPTTAQDLKSLHDAILAKQEAMAIPGVWLKPTCQPSIFIKPDASIVGTKYGNQKFTVFQPMRAHTGDSIWGYEFQDPWTFDWILADASQVTMSMGHTFKDYGMKRSWCDHCGVPGHFDPVSGTYKE